MAAHADIRKLLLDQGASRDNEELLQTMFDSTQVAHVRQQLRDEQHLLQRLAAQEEQQPTNHPNAVMEITVAVNQGQRLAAKDQNSPTTGKPTMSDPYVKVYLVVAGTSTKRLLGTTQVCPKTLDPIWMETFVGRHEYNNSSMEPVTIELELWDKDPRNGDDIMGVIPIRLPTTGDDIHTTHWYSVPKHSARNAKGKVEVALQTKTVVLPTTTTATTTTNNNTMAKVGKKNNNSPSNKENWNTGDQTLTTARSELSDMSSLEPLLRVGTTTTKTVEDTMAHLQHQLDWYKAQAAQSQQELADVRRKTRTLALEARTTMEASNQESQRMVENLRRAMLHLKAENRALATSKAALQQELDVLRNAEPTAVLLGEEDGEDWKSRLETAEQGYSDAKQQVTSLQESLVESTQAKAALQEELAHIKAAYDGQMQGSMTEESSYGSSFREQVEAARDQLMHMSEELEQAKEDKDAAEQEKVALASYVATMEEGMKTAKEALAKAQEDLAQAMEDKEAAQEQAEEFQQKVTDLEDLEYTQLQSAKDNLETLSEQVQTLGEERDAAMALKDELVRRVAQMEMEVRQMQDESSEEEDHEQLEAQLHATQEELDMMSVEANTAREELDHVTAIYQTTMEELRETKKRLEDLQQDREVLAMSSSQQSRGVTKELEQAKERIAELEASEEGLKESLKKSYDRVRVLEVFKTSVANVQDKLDSVQQELHKSNNEKAALNKQLADLQKATEETQRKFEQNIGTLEASLNKKAALAIAEQSKELDAYHAAKLEAVEARLADAESACQKLKTDLEAAKKVHSVEKDALEKTIAELEMSVQSNSKDRELGNLELAQTKLDLDAAVQAKAQLMSKLEAVQNSVKGSQAAYQKLKDELEEAKQAHLSEKEGLNKNIAELQVMIGNSASQLQMVSADLSQTKVDLDALERSKDAKEAKYKAVESSFKDSQTALQKLKDELEFAKKSHKSALVDKAKALNAAQEQVKSLQKEVEQSKSDADVQLKAAAADRQKDLDSFEETNAGLRRSLAASEEKMKKLKLTLVEATRASAKLENELHSVTKERDEVIQSREILKSSLRDIQEAMGKLKISLTAASDEKKVLEEDKEGLLDKVTELEQSVDEKTKALDETNVLLETCMSDYHALEAEMDRMYKQNKHWWECG